MIHVSMLDSPYALHLHRESQARRARAYAAAVRALPAPAPPPQAIEAASQAEALADLRREEEAERPLWTVPLVGKCRRARQVITTVAARRGVTPFDILSHSHRRGPTDARTEAIWLLHRETGWSLNTIGRSFERHHTTILTAIRRFEMMRAKDDELRAATDELLPTVCP
jgi:chromosomal replication initiation ATPase DnaA